MVTFTYIKRLLKDIPSKLQPLPFSSTSLRHTQLLSDLGSTTAFRSIALFVCGLSTVDCGLYL